MTNLVWSVLKPSHLLLYGLVFGVVFGSTRVGRRVLTASAVALVLSVVLPVGDHLLAGLEERFPSPASLERVDGIVVLAGSEAAKLSLVHGHPQFENFTDRLTTFLILANRYPEARLVHAGGSAMPEKNQSAPARDLILGSGIDPRRVTFEAESGNTCESARAVDELVRPRPDEVWVLVTTAGHVPRSVACFRAVRWDVTAFPTDFKADTSFEAFDVVRRLNVLDYATHEWLGLLYYRLLGRTDTLFPAP